MSVIAAVIAGVLWAAVIFYVFWPWRKNDHPRNQREHEEARIIKLEREQAEALAETNKSIRAYNTRMREFGAWLRARGPK
jgi:hypothetical protein